jgi:hypothetical protein
MACEKEAQLFERKLPELMKHAGKFALIHHESIEIFSNYADAVKAGYSRHGIDPFLVKEIKHPKQESFNCAEDS